MKTVLTKLYDTENDLIKKRRLAFEDLKNVIPKVGKKDEKEEEDNPSLKGIYDKFSDTMQKLEDEKEKQVLKIKTKLIPSTEAHITETKKKIMLHLINYEMAYHAKYIEKLTELFNDIKSSDLTKSIKESLMSVGVSQNVYDEDEDNANEESEKNDDEDDDNKNLKSSKLSKSKKSSTKKSKNKKAKNSDAEDNDDEEEKEDE